MASQKLLEDIQSEVDELVDFSPLVALMCIVAHEIQERGGSFDKAKARRVWKEILADFQGEWANSNHNPRIPCRFCDQSFMPVVDESLLTTFLPWYQDRRYQSLIAIHRCPSCGGSIATTGTEPYEGDYHTPAPGSIDNDYEWAEALLKHVEF